MLNNKIISLFVILLSFTVCIRAQLGYYNVNGTYTLYQNQNGNCVVVPEDVCTPCSLDGTTYYYSIQIISDIDFPIIINKYTDSQCTHILDNNGGARHADCSPDHHSCTVFYRLTEIEFAQLTISSEEMMIVGLVPEYSQEDVKVIANSKEVIANGTITGFQAYSSGILFQFRTRLSATRYNSTLGECNYDEVCISYPFTYTVSIISRETKIPSDKTFIVFSNVWIFSITDTEEEYKINSRFSDEIYDPALEFVYEKGEDIPTSFPGVVFYSPPKTGDHLQEVSEMELIPQENGAFYYLKYHLDWYHNFPYISNCTVRERRPQFNNDFIVCEIPVRSVEFPVDFNPENNLQLENSDEMSFQLF